MVASLLCPTCHNPVTESDAQLAYGTLYHTTCAVRRFCQGGCGISVLDTRGLYVDWTCEPCLGLYNGWTNHATWCVHLWLTNEEPLYRAYRRCRTEAQIRLLVWAEVEDRAMFLHGLAADLAGDARGFAGRHRAVYTALATVNWTELLEAATED